MWRKLRETDAQRHADRLRARLDPFDVARIDHLEPRRVTRIGGEVKRIGSAPRQGVAALEVVVSDGSGDAVAVFTGRRQIGGIDHGRLVVFEGIVREERGRKVFLNPAYTLVAD
jgi:hypothetical protein